MRRFLITGVLLLLSGLAGAQSGFNELIFSLWPEYDHPGVLVIYTGKADPDQLPQKLEFKIPDQTERVLSAGIVDTTSDLHPLEIQSVDGEKWINVTIMRPEFHIEFYYNPFSDDHNRHLEYDLHFGHAVPTVLLAVQKPLVVENFQPPYPAMETFSDQHGMTFYRQTVGPLAAGESLKLTVSYENHTGQTSIEQLQKMMGSSGTSSGMPPAPPAVERHSLPLYQPLLVLAVVVVIIGFLYFRRRASGEPEISPTSVKSNSGGSYCTRCGEAVNRSDKFCANCGEKLNVSNPA